MSYNVKPNDSKNLWAQLLRNGTPIVLTGLSAFLGVGILVGHMNNKANLPSFLFPPAICACISDILMAVVSLTAFVLIRQGEGYHSKNSSKHPGELKRLAHIQKYGTRLLTIVLGGLSIITSASYFYMLFFVIKDDKDNKYCWALTSQKEGCTDDLSYWALAFFAGVLCTAAALNIVLAVQIRKVEERFNMKANMHARRHGQGANMQSNRQSRGSDNFGGDDWDDQGDGAGLLR